MRLRKLSLSSILFLLIGSFFLIPVHAAPVITVPQSLSANQLFGTASSSIPIELPPGRAGIQPSINLVYSSSSPNGQLGYGWQLPFGYIERSLKNGVPSYTNQDTFVLNEGGAQELVDVSGTLTKFRQKTEESFLDIQYTGEVWILTDKKGTKYFYGNSDESRDYDRTAGSTNKVFRWHLSHVQDINGNFMTFNYTNENNVLHLWRIDYTGNRITGNTTKVLFTWSDRPDPMKSYATGYLKEETRRLSQIEIFAGGEYTSKYALEYDQDSEMGKSLLKKVTKFGNDGVSSLPATTFSYSSANTNFSTPTNFSNYPSNKAFGTVKLADMNKDGYVDILEGYIGTTQDYYIYFNNKNNDFAPRQAAINSPKFGTDNPNMRFADFTGDGLIDIMYAAGIYQLWINNGQNGFELGKNVSYYPNLNAGSSPLVQFVDMNGDGKTDILEAGFQNYKVYYSTGTNFSAPITLANSPRGTDDPNIRLLDLNADGVLDVLYGANCPYQIWINTKQNGFSGPFSVDQCPNISVSAGNGNGDLVRFIDMNSDGLTDMIRTSGGNNNPWNIYLNNGKNNFNSYFAATNPPARSLENPNVELADFNGDGLIDVMYGTTYDGWQMSLNNGYNGFDSMKIITNRSPDRNLDNWTLHLTDVNGDTRPDIVQGAHDAQYKAWLSTTDAASSKPNVLVKVENGAGLTTQLTYSWSFVANLTGWQNRYAYTPVQLATLKSITNTVLSNTTTTNFTYEGGLWNNIEKEFRGFATVKAFDALQNFSVTKYAQDDTYKGRILEQATYASGGALFNKTINLWDVQTVNTGVQFIFLKRTDNFVYDGNASGKRTAEEYTYGEIPQLGNLTQVNQLGEVDLVIGNDVGTDKRSVETVFSNNMNTDIWLIGFPQYVQVKDNAGALVRKTWFYYDNATSTTTLPVKGLLTQKKNWAGDAPGTVHPTTTYTYSPEGNLLTTKDSLLNTTTLTYDSVYKVFLLTNKNALGQIVKNEYYGIDGVPLNDGTYQGAWGSLKSTTDPNNKKGLSTQDVFGRVIKSVSPKDTILLPTNQISYEYLNGFSRVKTSIRKDSGQAGVLEGYQFYDGAGRLIQTKSFSETPGMFNVSGHKIYNSLGQVEKEFLPFTVTTPITELDPIVSTRPHIEYTYDAMGRLIKVLQADGLTSAEMSYDDWVTTSINENGRQQKSYTDAYGRLIQKEEFFGSSGKDPINYPQSNFTSYALTTFKYDSEGNLLETTDAKGNKTIISHNVLGQKISMMDPDMGVWNYTYDLNGNLKTQTDAKGKTLSFTYDKLNRLTAKSDGAALNVSYTYDAGSNSKGRITKATYGADSTSFSYDELGREISSTKTIDGVGYTVKRTYDALNRLTMLQYPDQSKVYYTYNAAGQIETVADGVSSPPQTLTSAYVQYTLNDNATSTTVTATGTGASLNSALASVNTNVLSQAGKINREFKLDGDIQYIQIDNLLSSIRNDSTGSFTLWVKPERYGTILSFGSSGGYIEFAYDDVAQNLSLSISGRGSALRCKTPVGSMPVNVYRHVALVQDGTAIKIYINGVSQTLSFLVDAVKGAWFTYTWEAPLTFGRIGAFNASNNLNSNNAFFKGSLDDIRYFKKVLTAQEVKVVYNKKTGTEGLNPVIPGTEQVPANVYVKNVDYNVIGQMTKIEYGNGNTTTYEYNVLSRLKKMMTVNGTGVLLQNFEYVYDLGGNILQIIDTVNTGSKSFKYDHLNRLVQMTDVSGTKTYGFDQLGNILAKEGINYTYNGTIKPHAVMNLSDGTAFTYDADGNMATRTKGPDFTEYSYDTDNRLLEVKKSGVVQAQFAYDGDGGRVKKIAGGVTTKYIGDLFEDNGVVTKYIYLGSQKVASLTGTTKLFFLSDHLGGVNIVTDKSGAKKELMEYNPFGTFFRHEKYGSSSEVANFYFTGKKLDEETGLYYYGARYYDPSLGRFITPDTIVQSPSNPQNLNRYSYCSNNPVNRVDPTGHSWKNFWKKYGDFIGPLGRAIVTGDWANFGYQLINIGTMALGAITCNPWLVASGALAYASRATAHIGGNASIEISRAFGYASMAAAVVGAFYTPVGPPSAELGYNGATGEWVGTVTLEKIVVTKSKEAIDAVKITKLGHNISTGFAAVQAGIAATDFTQLGFGLAKGVVQNIVKYQQSVGPITPWNQVQFQSMAPFLSGMQSLSILNAGLDTAGSVDAALASQLTVNQAVAKIAIDALGNMGKIVGGVFGGSVGFAIGGVVTGGNLLGAVGGGVAGIYGIGGYIGRKIDGITSSIYKEVGIQ